MCDLSCNHNLTDEDCTVYIDYKTKRMVVPESYHAICTECGVAFIVTRKDGELIIR